MKITIIGAGNVGANVAYALILRQVCNEIVLIDTDEDKLIARDLELEHSGVKFGDRFALHERLRALRK